MRKDQLAVGEAPELSEAPAPPETLDAAEAAVATGIPASPPPPSTSLTRLMAFTEPQRTDALERAVNSGMAVYLCSKTGAELRARYGEHILTVPTKPKPFIAAHAIHLLWYFKGQIAEVADPA